MKKLGVLLISLLALTACDPWLSNNNIFARTFEGFVDHDIRDAINYYGEVDDAFERNDGLRVFQWKVKGPFKQKQVANEVLLARTYQLSPYFNPDSQLSNKNAHHLQCYYNVGARWYAERNAWIVEEVELPAKRCR